ncbi:MAG: hypothetical protein A3G81_00110 [Betaproteobacteria bacterium RIFCSPLOWO2_12_FULL_65_14]|nr:MAG: hypothetical protein A3G81_00110 [Betaproteobacteria bacterium RIFCSPLOWO2_12_FULL_65_14]
MTRNLIVTALVAVIIAGFVLGARYLFGAVVPPVDGFTEGERIRFIHTEASDPQVAALLTRMKGSPVIVVPELAKVPKELLTSVYVFKNGVKGNGPFEFQADVFDNPPGTKGYSPLRSLHLLTWKNEAAARELRSAAEVRKAIDAGELVVEQPGVVVNMPLLTWPGGNR